VMSGGMPPAAAISAWLASLPDAMLHMALAISLSALIGSQPGTVRSDRSSECTGDGSAGGALPPMPTTTLNELIASGERVIGACIGGGSSTAIGCIEGVNWIDSSSYDGRMDAIDGVEAPAPSPSADGTRRCSSSITLIASTPLRRSATSSGMPPAFATAS
jgi:hypothetical protein